MWIGVGVWSNIPSNEQTNERRLKSCRPFRKYKLALTLMWLDEKSASNELEHLYVDGM